MNNLRSWQRSITIMLVLLPGVALAAGRHPESVPAPTVYTPYCAAPLGSPQNPWPAYSDSAAVNKFRTQVIYALKSLYGFEYDEYSFPEETLLIGDPARPITLPQGWFIGMDAYPGGYSVAVAIPPKNGPFADEVGLRALLTKMNQIFGGGGAVTMPVAGDLEKGVRLPCSAHDATKRAPAIMVGIPYKGETGAEM